MAAKDMPPAPSILASTSQHRNAGFANDVLNFADRAMARLPGFTWLGIGAAAATILMVVVGAFGTGGMPIGMRAGFWAVLIGWNAVKWQIWFALTVRRPSHWWRASALGAVLLNLPLPFEIRAALSLFSIGEATNPMTIWMEALAISALLFVLLLLVRWRLTETQASATPPAIRLDGLLARAGVGHPASLLAIIAEDHYCRLHLDGGASLLVHHKFSDALEEVAELEGMQVHRSAWVTNASVIGARRLGRRWHLQLKNGLEIPVSARYVPAVRARGWFKRQA